MAHEACRHGQRCTGSSPAACCLLRNFDAVSLVPPMRCYAAAPGRHHTRPLIVEKNMKMIAVTAIPSLLKRAAC